ncbi:DUF3857 domain-containing protein [Luteolibacter sp. LG18]|uniref:DUF3857 domain-containing protein n=1 Tax=Luteolibacter sp. LG18 TaxID=2819286 RepID=UPI0030C6FC6F
MAILGSIGLSRAEVSQTPPPEYEESLAPLLTPFEEITKAKDPFAGKDEGGTVRLSESATRVHEDGSYLRAQHTVIRPYTEQGAKESSTRRFRFQAHLETVHVVKARTVLADGTEKVLGPNAAFIQKGDQGSDSIYDDGQDLVLIFPDVKPGVQCEAIVVFERKVPTVAGGYSEFMDWTAGWPIALKRRVIDLPAAWESRVKVETVGKRPVAATEAAPIPGRWRRVWQRENIESTPDEPEEAPPQQVGPGTWLTTFGSWDELAAWYGGLLAERSELGDTLKAKVEEWTKEAKSPREILDVLHDHVANDVRYEGLEFGISGLQPYACETVWKNQYGDCKDKANLLVAMLRHKGVAAKVVLVNTEHAGLVARHIPDYRHFNHAIAVAELPDGKGGVTRVFCDATITKGRPGLLSPGDADRDVLAIHGNKAEWLRTPSARSGESHYTLDLEMTQEGRISGWMTVKATGFNSVQMARAFAGVDRDTARQKLHSYASSFFPGAEVMDFVLPAEKREVEEAELKIYLTTPPRQMDNAGRLSLPFPWARWFFGDFGEGKDRRTSFFQAIERFRVTAKIQLPEGWQPESLPSPLKLDTPPFQASSQWTHAANRCEATLDLDYREAVIPADKVAAPAQANRAMLAWLQTPLALKKGSGAVQGGAPKAQVAMPLMPTGKGQMSLVNRWFPSTGDASKRQAALEQVIRYFPNDPETVFYARTELACQKFDAKQYDAALTALRELVERKPDGVSAEYWGFARYFEGLTLHELNKDEEALAVMKEVAANGEISDYRRNWSARFAGEWLAKRNPVPAEAVTLLKQAAAEEECRAFALSQLVPAMAAAGQGDALVSALADGSLFEGEEDGGTAVIEEITRVAKAGDKAAMASLLPWLQKARDAAGTGPTAKPLAAACATLESWSTRGDTYAKLRSEVLAILERKRPDDFKNTSIDTCDSVEKALAKMEELGKKDSHALLGMSAGYFRKYEASDEFPHALWQYLSHLKVVERSAGTTADAGAFQELVEVGCKLPHDNDNYWECLFLKAGWLDDQEKLDEAIALYRAMPEDPQFMPAFEKSVWFRLGKAYEARGLWKEAIECYLKFKDQRQEHKAVVEQLVRAGLLMARSGDREEALELWALLADVPASVYESSEILPEIQDVIALAANPKATLRQWEESEDWWKHTYIPYHRSLKGDLPVRQPIVLSDEGDDTILRCRKAVAEKDLKRVLEEVASVAFTSRWLPCHVLSVRGMLDQYVKPLAPDSYRGGQLCFAKLAGTVRAGQPATVEMCIRLDAALHFDLGDTEHALKVADDQWQEAPGRSAEHRERCAWLFAMAANATGKKVSEALEASTYWVEHSGGFLTVGQWAPVHADLLARSGKRAEALTFLRSKVAQAKGKPALTTPILEKISQLEAQGEGKEGLAAAAEALLKKYKPVWYDHVGPKALDDPRVGDPTKISEADLTRFHAAERFRLRMLVVMSPDVEIRVRERALTDATMDLGKQQTTWKQAVAIWREVLDQQKVSTPCRLHMLWKFALELASAGQVDALAELRKSPVFSAYAPAYTERYFPMVEKIAKGMRDGPEDFKEALALLNDRELDGEDLPLATLCHTGLLGAGDAEGAAAAREALKNWKLSPAIAGERNTTRLSWMRMANLSKPALAFHDGMLALFRERLEALAQKAPAGWQQRVDLETMGDLTEADRHAIDAARLTTGKRMDKTGVKDWLITRDTWLNATGKRDPAMIAEVFKLAESLGEPLTGATVATILYSFDPPDDPAPASLSGALKIFKDSPANAVVSFWQGTRGYKPGIPVELDKNLALVSQVPSFMRLPMRGNLLETTWVNGDQRQVNQTLDSIKPDEEMSANFFQIYLPVLQEMKRQEELEIANEDAVKIIRDEMITTWRDRNSNSLHRACDLALLCDRKDLLPDAWRASVPGLLAMDYEKAFARARLAQLKGDWKTMKAELEAAKEIPPREKTNQTWFMACALDGLGEKARAIEYARQCVALGNANNRYFVAAIRYLRHAGAEIPKPGK